jgi:hypothetical protein
MKASGEIISGRSPFSCDGMAENITAAANVMKEEARRVDLDDTIHDC